jgi:ferrochelatase
VTTGVLVMAYGTPRDRDDVAAYYTDIRRGRPPTDEQLADLVARYDAIGGTFPLRAITEAQVAAIASNLGDGYVTEAGYKHAAPSIEDATATLAGKGANHIVGLVLAPHFSALSVGEYARRASHAAAARGVEMDVIESWHLMPAYLDFLARAVTDAQGELPEEVRRDADVVFTAHSLPEKAVPAGDPYPDQVRATAESVATLADLFRWSTAWQSAGRTPDPWLGPDVLDVIRVAADEGERGVVVCACGFVADHLEVAYDLDVAARGLAAELGVPFARTRSVNDDPAVLAALAGLVRDRAAQAAGDDHDHDRRS